MVGNFAITADSISKRYSIGQREPYKALRDKLANVLSSPFQKPPGKPQLLWDGEPQNVITSYIGATAADAADYEISEETHVTGTSKVRVRRVRLLDSHEAGTFTVFWNQPIQLALEFEVRKPIKDASFGVGVVTTNGIPLLTVHHNDNDGQLLSLECGVYIMHVTLENPLRAGTYRFVFGSHEGLAKTSIFYIPDAVQFEVLDVGQGTEHYIHHNEGLINGNATWRLASHSTQPAL